MKESKILPALIIGISMVTAALVFGSYYYTAQSSLATNNQLSVTGSTKTHVTSDKAKLVVTISHITAEEDLSSGYSLVGRDLNLVNKLINDKGLSKSATESPVFMNQHYDNNYDNITRYNLNQTITIQSDNVADVTELSKQIPSLADEGALVSVQSIEYLYSKLPELRVSLLSDAVEDAKARADKIAEATGMSVGNVQSASAGVVQVLSADSIEISDYGSYDTSTIEKDVMVTVRATFRLED